MNLGIPVVQKIQLRRIALALILLTPFMTSPSQAIDFGDNSGPWPYDDECNDPRFYGFGMASLLMDEDIRADAADYRALYAQGSVFWN